jgi:SAM-dependent methyltransferase
MFKDHFSAHSRDYARYRPSYPAALFEYLAHASPNRNLAWDAATGSGQAALNLAEYFSRVRATDASEQQIENATPHERIEYRVEPAEASSLADDSVDLITVAQALHWFDLDRFYPEARRALKARGVIAAWTYGTCSIAPAVDKVVAWFYHEVVGAYWPEERKLVEQGYRALPFPFERVGAPSFAMTANWNMHDFIGYLGTWSATQRYCDARQHGYREVIAPPLARAWEDSDHVQLVRWPVHLLVGRCSRE